MSIIVSCPRKLNIAIANNEMTMPVCPNISADFYRKYFDSAGYEKHINIFTKFTIYTPHITGTGKLPASLSLMKICV